MSLLDLFRSESEECSHDWEESGKHFRSSGPYFSEKKNCQYAYHDIWQDYKCKDCDERKRGDRIEEKTLIWYADEVYKGEDAKPKRDELMENV